MISRALVVICLIGTAVVATPDGAAAQPGCNDGIFSTEWAQFAADELGEVAATASVFDTRTGCWYGYKPSLVLTTASAVKLEILAANLDRVESAGRGLDPSEIAAAERMLWFSHNAPPTSSLHTQVGVSGMQQFSAAVGANQTQHSSIYGVTTASAKDLTRVALATLDLHGESRSPLAVARWLVNCWRRSISPNAGV